MNAMTPMNAPRARARRVDAPNPGARPWLLAAAITAAALVPAGCATPDAPKPATGAPAAKAAPAAKPAPAPEPAPAPSTATSPATKDVVRGVLGGFSIGGINLGAAAGATMNAAEAMREPTEAEEIGMGRNIAAGLLGAVPVSRNVAQERYVNNVGRWLALHSGRPDLPWKFGILETESVNAFATPGGNIFVTRGLVSRIRSESELAGVLAHEIAHVALKHHLNDIRKQASKGLVLDLAALRGGGLTGEAARAVARVGLEGFVRGLSREDEMEADRLGVMIAARAGYEPYGLPAVLQILSSLPQDDSGMALFLATHPSPSDRLAALASAMPASYEAYAKPNPALARYGQTFRAR